MASTQETDAPTTPQIPAQDSDQSVFTDGPAQAQSPAPNTGTSLSIAALVLGVASFVFGFSFVVPLAGLVLGIMALGREPAGKTLAIIGIVSSALNLGWIIIVALGLAVLIPFAGFMLPWMI